VPARQNSERFPSPNCVRFCYLTKFYAQRLDGRGGLTRLADVVSGCDEYRELTLWRGKSRNGLINRSNNQFFVRLCKLSPDTDDPVGSHDIQKLIQCSKNSVRCLKKDDQASL